MSVTVVRELDTGAEVDAANGPRPVRRFSVKFDSASYLNRTAALTASAGGVTIPAMYEAWPATFSGFPTPKVRNIRSDPLTEKDTTRYIVTVTYSLSSQEKIESQETAPWLEDPLVEYDLKQYPEPLDVDTEGIIVRNSATEPFDPQPEIEIAHRIIRVTRSTQTYNPATAAALVNTINAGAVTVQGESIAAKMARLLRWSGSEAKWVQGDGTEATYWQETIEIEVVPDGRDWRLRLIDKGYSVLDAGEPVRKLDSNGRPVPTPIFLDGAGAKLSGSTPYTLTFDPYEAADWSALGSL